MNHASLNVANALGAWLGGLAIALGYGYRSPALVGLALSVAGRGGAAGLLGRSPDGRRTSPPSHCVVGLACAY